MSRQRGGGLTLIGAVALAAMCGFSAWQSHRAFNQHVRMLGYQAVPWPQSPWKNARLTVKYVGDEVCAVSRPDLANF